ncbi:MAG TPA: dipeptidase [Solirubrobacteraceae bacterium]|jgi:membrane dipeptidase|nr:dipeptidase [Solirubrobacteraceae bacterium]
MQLQSTTQLHRDAVVIDAVCPIQYWQPHVQKWVDGGVTCTAVTVAFGSNSAREALGEIGRTFELVRRRDELLIATSADDILRAKQLGKLAIVFHFQGTGPIEYDVNLLEVFWRLGVRVIQIAYNRRNPLGDGCEEPSDAGLSLFGRQAIAEMNRLGLVVDVSHTGERTAIQAIEASAAPCIASHSNPFAVYPSPRNVSDELIRAVAASGGVIGANGFPSFVSAEAEPTLDRFIDHITYIADLVGPDHVALGIDYFDASRDEYDAFVAAGLWSPETYSPPPWHYPAGIESPSGLPRLTERLIERGFAESEVRNILGENWLRVYRQVWRESI